MSNLDDMNEVLKSAISKLNHRGKDTRSHRQIMKRFSDARISQPDINLQVRRASIDGNDIPPTEVPTYNLPKHIKKKIAVSRISDEDYIILQQYAKYLPRGKRELLRLDMPEMKKLLLGNILEKASLTNDSGLRNGGQVAQMVLEDDANDKIVKKLLTQQEQHKIYNGQAVQSIYNYNKGFALNNQNPNPNGFINHFKLVSKTKKRDFRNHF